VTRPRLAPPRLADLLAGISVALVALPQALAYAELAGMPPVTGLWAIIPALLLAAPFLSARELQVGPVATTSLLAFGTLSALAAPGSPEWVARAALLALMVGAIRIAIGLLGWGRLAYLLSRPVRIGFLNAAAVLIALSQVPSALGVTVEGGVLPAAWRALRAPAGWDLEALGFAVATVVIIRLARRVHPLVPGVVIAVVASLLVARWIGYAGPTVGTIQDAWPRLRLALPWSDVPRLAIGALVLALVGFSEAAAIGRDLAARARRPWSPDREFVAQGVANVAAGLFGGFPLGASFSRSAVNRLAGARTRWSSFLTGLALLALIPLTPTLADLPRAALAGVILAAVASLLKPGELLSVLRGSRSQGVIALATFVLTLALAPRIDEAVLIGVVLAAGQHLRREQNLRLEVWREDDRLIIAPRGVLWYGSTQRFEEALPDLLAAHPDATELAIDLSGCGRVDWSAAMAVREALEDAGQADMHGFLVGLPSHTERWRANVWRDVEVR
jgi:SulP family sulfate permease